MITYNDIYESKRHPLVSFELPLISERQFLIASSEIAKTPSFELPLISERQFLIASSEIAKTHRRKK